MKKGALAPGYVLFRSGTMRLKPQTYAVTISTYQQHRHFQRTANAELFIATLFRYREVGKFLLHGFVVMPDHVHVLTHPPNPRAKRFHAQIQYIANNPIRKGYSNYPHVHTTHSAPLDAPLHLIE